MNTDTIFLGDRVAVKSLAIDHDKIVVDTTTHAPKDPRCSPTVREIKQFAVQNNRLIQVSKNSPTNEAPLLGRVWRWVETRYNDDTRLTPANPEKYTVQFLDDGKINIKADCNVKGGTYSHDDHRVSITITHSTMAACEPGSLEDSFVRDLSGAAIYFFRKGHLNIDLQYDTGTMEFSPL